MGISFWRTIIILTASAVVGTIIGPSCSSQQQQQLVMARTLPGSALDQLDVYLPEKAMVISKKSATALNKLMLALRSYEKNSVEKGGGGGPDAVVVGEPGKSNPAYDTFNMQRRNQKDRKIYLRCYFNAVSCF